MHQRASAPLDILPAPLTRTLTSGPFPIPVCLVLFRARLTTSELGNGHYPAHLLISGSEDGPYAMSCTCRRPQTFGLPCAGNLAVMRGKVHSRWRNDICSFNRYEGLRLYRRTRSEVLMWPFVRWVLLTRNIPTVNWNNISDFNDQCTHCLLQLLPLRPLAHAQQPSVKGQTTCEGLSTKRTTWTSISAPPKARPTNFACLFGVSSSERTFSRPPRWKAKQGP